MGQGFTVTGSTSLEFRMQLVAGVFPASKKIHALILDKMLALTWAHYTK
jgi:hypothetical protein